MYKHKFHKIRQVRLLHFNLILRRRVKFVDRLLSQDIKDRILIGDYRDIKGAASDRR